MEWMKMHACYECDEKRSGVTVTKEIIITANFLHGRSTNFPILSNEVRFEVYKNNNDKNTEDAKKIGNHPFRRHISSKYDRYDRCVRYDRHDRYDRWDRCKLRKLTTIRLRKNASHRTDNETRFLQFLNGPSLHQRVESGGCRATKLKQHTEKTHVAVEHEGVIEITK